MLISKRKTWSLFRTFLLIGIFASFFHVASFAGCDQLFSNYFQKDIHAEDTITTRVMKEQPLGYAALHPPVAEAITSLYGEINRLEYHHANRRLSGGLLIDFHRQVSNILKKARLGLHGQSGEAAKVLTLMQRKWRKHSIEMKKVKQNRLSGVFGVYRGFVSEMIVGLSMNQAFQFGVTFRKFAKIFKRYVNNEYKLRRFLNRKENMGEIDLVQLVGPNHILVSEIKNCKDCSDKKLIDQIKKSQRLSKFFNLTIEYQYIGLQPASPLLKKKLKKIGVKVI